MENEKSIEKKLLRRREIARNWYHRHKVLKGKTTKEKTCPICGKLFFTDTNKIYCSDECKKQARKNTINKYNKNHKEEINKKRLIYEANNREKIKARRKKYYYEYGLKERVAKYAKDNAKQINERIKRWRKENPEKDRLIRDRYKQNNYEAIKKRAREKRKEYYQDINKRLKFNISRAFNRYFTKSMTTAEYMKYFNYTIEDLKQHIENQFKDNMNWQNYGTLWHIDHIKPQSWFDFNDITQIKECWSLKNLQPLYATVNLSKGNRYEG